MTTKRWLTLTLVLIVGSTAAFAAFNYIFDPYCIFRCKPGRLIPVYTNERTTKYLFGYNYIPTNFDGVLIGSSISGNWNTANIRGYKVYNTSLSGGNTAEAALIADHVFDRGKTRLAIFIVHAAMADGHEPKSGSMNPQEYWGSLGSIPLLQSYASRLLGSVGLSRNECDAFGVYDISGLLAARAKLVSEANLSNTSQVQQEAQAPVAATPSNASALDPPADEIAVAQYRKLIERARSKGAVIVAVVPPRPSWPGQTLMHDAATARLLESFLPQDIVIDGYSNAFKELREKRDNFWDGLHLTDAAADIVVESIFQSLAGRGESRGQH